MSRVGEGSTWEQLSLYESRDMIQRAFRDRHGRDLNADKALAITANVAQGRQYFAGAQSAGELISPLLLYYGVLSLTRGLLLYLDRSGQANTVAGHGVLAVRWEQTLGR